MSFHLQNGAEEGKSPKFQGNQGDIHHTPLVFYVLPEGSSWQEWGSSIPCVNSILAAGAVF